VIPVAADALSELLQAGGSRGADPSAEGRVGLSHLHDVEHAGRHQDHLDHLDHAVARGSVGGRDRGPLFSTAPGVFTPSVVLDAKVAGAAPTA
jgi:hypothetical protein